LTYLARTDRILQFSDISHDSIKGEKMSKKEHNRLNLGKTNIILLIVAAILLIAGYLVMTLNEINVSPVLLLIAYAVVIPIALLLPPKKGD